jgi:hypothetical protein
VDINALCDDVLLHIFSFIWPTNYINKVLVLVCSRWNKLVLNNDRRVYKHRVRKILKTLYDSMLNGRSELDDDSSKYYHGPSKHFFGEEDDAVFQIVGFSSWKYLYYRLTNKEKDQSQILNKLLFTLSAIEAAKIRASSNSSKSNPTTEEPSLYNLETVSALHQNLNASSYLSSLLLEGVELEFLPKALFRLNFLREIDLSYNKLTFIPKEFAFLTNLRQLYLSHNRIETIESILVENAPSTGMTQ